MINYGYVYDQFFCSDERKLPPFIYESEKRARKMGEKRYRSIANVDFVSITKLSNKSYFVVWRVTGESKERGLVHE